MTGRDLVNASLRLIGVIEPGETSAAQEATDGLSALNRMLGSWSTEGLLIHAITEESPLTLTAGDGTVTLGAAGDITTRPMSIEKALIRDGDTDYPVHILSLEEFARISDKSLQSTYPYSLYDDGGYPQRTIKLYPVPSAEKSLILFTLRPLAAIATLDTEISLPPGYERAVIYNGALELAPEYGKQVPEAVAINAVEAKANIKRANHRQSYLRCDSVPSGRRYSFDIDTGGYR